MWIRSKLKWLRNFRRYFKALQYKLYGAPEELMRVSKDHNNKEQCNVYKFKVGGLLAFAETTFEILIKRVTNKYLFFYLSSVSEW